MICRRGFTLVELTAVLVVLALLSAVVGLSLASVSRQTSLQDVRGAITDLDRSMRVECVDYDRTGELRFDLETGLVELSMVREGEAVRVQAHQLPAGMRFGSVQIAGLEPVDRRAGYVVVSCDNRGRTPTYALTLIAVYPPDTKSLRLVVAGLSGQVKEVRDDDQIENLFTALASGHAD